MSKEEEKKGRLWTPEQDAILIACVTRHGEGDWDTVQKNTGLSRNKESCRIRWTYHLKPGLNKDPFTPEEDAHIIKLQARLGNKWSLIAAELPGRTCIGIKSHWKSSDIKRKLAKRSQQEVGVSQATGNPDTTEKSSMLGHGSGSSQLPILCPNPDTTEKISMLGQGSGSGSSQLPILCPIPDTTGKSSMLGQGSGTGSSQLPILFPNPDTTGKSSMLAQGSGSSQLPIVYPNPDMQQYNTSSAQLPSLTGLEIRQGSSSSDLSGNVSVLPLNKQVDSNSTDEEDSLSELLRNFSSHQRKISEF